jgi:hypothetical protein
MNVSMMVLHTKKVRRSIQKMHLVRGVSVRMDLMVNVKSMHNLVSYTDILFREAYWCVCYKLRPPITWISLKHPSFSHIQFHRRQTFKKKCNQHDLQWHDWPSFRLIDSKVIYVAQYRHTGNMLQSVRLFSLSETSLKRTHFEKKVTLFFIMYI